LDSILNLEYPKELIELYWLVQDNDGTLEVLEDFRRRFEDKYAFIQILETDSIKDPDRPRIRNVVRNYNILVAYSHPLDLILIDSDNFPVKYLVKRLLMLRELGADIATGVTSFPRYINGKYYLGFSAKIREGDKVYYPLIEENGSIYLHKFIAHNVFRADITGFPSTLIKRELLKKHTFKLPDPNQFGGCDIEYSCRVRKEGYTILADYDLYVPHYVSHLIWEDKGDRYMLRAIFKKGELERKWMQLYKLGDRRLLRRHNK